MRYLENYLSGYLLPPSLGWNVPLNELWKTGNGKQIVLSYNYYGRVDMKMVWPRVVQKWGNVHSLIDLRNYLTGVFNRYKASEVIRETARTCLKLLVELFFISDKNQTL